MSTIVPAKSDGIASRRGESNARLAQWSSVAETPVMSFILHPPVSAEVAYRLDRYILLLAYGSATVDVRIDDGGMRRVRLRNGSLIFVEPNRSVWVRQHEPIELLVLSVDANHFALLAEAAASGKIWHTSTLVDHLDPGVAAVGLEIRRSLLADNFAPPPYLQALADSILMRLVCRFLGEVERAHRGEDLAPVILSRVLRHIDEHLAEPLHVEELAALAGLSRAHFSRAFRRVTGDPPRRFVLKRRLCRARDLISAGARSLAEIAAETGFSSQAHLSTVFRKQVGTTPGQYRDAFRGTTTATGM